MENEIDLGKRASFILIVLLLVLALRTFLFDSGKSNPVRTGIATFQNELPKKS